MLNPITREIISGALDSVIREMEILMDRTSMSPFIKEKKDFFVGIYDRDGQIVRAHLSYNGPGMLDCIFEQYPRESMQPGDVYWFNDPYLSRGALQHSQDMTFARPIFFDGELVAFSVCFGHFWDIGGARAGSISPTATEIFQEGTLVPPIRIVKAGVLNDEAYRIFLRNSRMPDYLEGDTRAMMAATALGETRVLEVFQRFGAPTTLAAFDAMIESTRRRVQELAKQVIPEGEWTFHNGGEFNAESVKFSIARAIHTKLNTLPRVVWPPSFGQEVEFVVGDRSVVEANPDYWGPKPATPRIVWQVIPDAATRLAALQRGAVDIIVNLPAPLVPAAEGDPNLRVYSELGSTVHILFLNARETAPLKDRRVRQALNHAVDREAILKNLYGGRGKPLTTATARQVTNAIDAGVFAYDPDRARRLLAEAGYPNGFELSLWQAIGRWSQAEEAAQVIAGYFDKIGVRTKLQTLEWGEYNKRASGSLFKDAFYYAIINGTWDASYTWGRFQPAFPAFRYYDAESDLRKALVEYDQAFDAGKRKELAAWIQKTLRDEAVWVFLWQLDEIFGLSKKVKGFKMRPDHMIWVRETRVES